MSDKELNAVTLFGQNNVSTNKLTISDHRGLVIIHFEKRVDFVALKTDEARQTGEALARQAYKAHYGAYPTTVDGSIFTEQRRIRARHRAISMLPKEPWKTTAERDLWCAALVDEVMKLVLT